MVKNMINIWAILVITVIYFILGGLWFTPFLFGKAWAKALNFNLDERNPKPKHFISALIANFITTLFLALLLELIGFYDLLIALIVAVIIGIGFVLPIGLIDVIFEEKNFKAYLIDAGYHIVGIIIAGLILGAWQI
ncbi:MAG: DUF1761 domain-containing protein [Promethearchaeota archaeon]|nr:MAG: DUF1761 domain-containing protein [Candidatus Lokiarchaeota archaeon]